MIIVCAWCGNTLGEKPPLKDTSVTHTICEKCFKQAVREVLSRL